MHTRNKNTLSPKNDNISNPYLTLWGLLILFLIFFISACTCAGPTEPASDSKSGTNVTISNHIISVHSRFYDSTNHIFSNEVHALIYYKSGGGGGADSTNIYISNAYNSNNIGAFFLSNEVSMMTNTVTRIAIISNSSSNYSTTNYENSFAVSTNYLTNYSYTNSTLKGTNEVTNLNWANWNFAGANLADLNLSNYDFTGANFSNANLSNANLIKVNLGGANLTNANFTNAQVSFTGYVHLANLGYEGYFSDDFQKALASDGTNDDQFGFSTAISGDHAIVGAALNDDNGSTSGSAYIFTRSGSTWFQQKITPEDGTNDDQFGYSVAISGDYAIVGAHKDDDDDDTSSGSAYIFTRNNDTWSQQAKLLPSDGENSDEFGISVAISGAYAIVGAHLNDDNGTSSGSAYIFTRSETNWSQQAKLLPNGGTNGDQFGLSVAISGAYAVVGAHLNDDDAGEDSGSAYIFIRSNNTWTQQAKLLPNDGARDDEFGRSVAISGAYAVVGAHLDDDKGTSSGSAYIFTRRGTNWSEQAKLLPRDGGIDDRFGYSVAISGAYAVVGANFNDDNGANNSGSAYIFTRSGDNWSEQAKLLPNDGGASDNFGISVAISEDYGIVGAYQDDDKGANSGSSYIVKFREE